MMFGIDPRKFSECRGKHDLRATAMVSVKPHRQKPIGVLMRCVHCQFEKYQWFREGEAPSVFVNEGGIPAIKAPA
jgi:hypothetical protein